MEVQVKVTKYAKAILVKANVRYWEDSEIDGIETPENGKGFPCKDGDLWCVGIDIETGKVNNYNFDKPVKTHFKVCDQCSYYVYDVLGAEILRVENEYVPDILCPGGEGYGDCIIMNISKDGIIEDWNKNKILELFE